MYGPKPQGMTFCARAVLYSGWKLNGVPLQSVMLVFMKALAAEAVMKSLCPVDRSVSCVSKAWPPGMVASNMRTLIRSPGFIIRVCRLGVNEVPSLSSGLGGPVGTPLVWTKAKLTGSVQFWLHPVGANPLPEHSRLSMLSAEHQCASSQLMLSVKGAKPGG